MSVKAGHRFPDRQLVVDRARVEEFVLALGVAPEEGWSAEPGVAVPPGFLMYVTSYGADAVHDALGLDMLRTVYGGTDLEQLALVRVGQVLTVRPVVSGITEKTGSRGRLRIVELIVDYLDSAGDLVARERSATVERG